MDLIWGYTEMATVQNWLETESGGIMLRSELRARRRIILLFEIIVPLLRKAPFIDNSTLLD